MCVCVCVVCVCVCECECELVCVCVWVCACECECECESVWVWVWGVWCVCECESVWVCVCVCVVCVCVSEWVSEWVSECVLCVCCVCVCGVWCVLWSAYDGTCAGMHSHVRLNSALVCVCSVQRGIYCCLWEDHTHTHHTHTHTHTHTSVCVLHRKTDLVLPSRCQHFAIKKCISMCPLSYFFVNDFSILKAPVCTSRNLIHASLFPSLFFQSYNCFLINWTHSWNVPSSRSLIKPRPFVSRCERSGSKFSCVSVELILCFCSQWLLYNL